MKQQPAAPTPRFVQAQALAEMLGVSRSTIWLWARTGRLAPPTYIGGAPTPLWDLGAVLASAASAPITSRRLSTRKPKAD